MVLGESAGIAAAVVIEDETSVQDLSYDKLSERLKKQGQILDLPPFALDTAKSNSY